MIQVTDKARDYILQKGGAVHVFEVRRASLC